MAAAAGADCLPPLLTALDHWIARAGRPQGAAAAYFSNLVVIYRLVAITWAAPFLAAQAQGGDATAARICLRLFRILAADVQYLQPRLGDSVGNNHLLADRFAAWFLAAAYPGLWSGAARGDLEALWQQELARQFQADGTNFEQSTHYHELGCEMALAYLVAALRRGEGPAPETLTLIRQMLRFQAALSDEAGGVFALGDATDDPLLPLGTSTGCAGGAWRWLYRVLFDAAADAATGAGNGAERAYWLLAALPSQMLPLPLPTPPEPIGEFLLFGDNGYAVCRDDAGAQRLAFRSGPRPGVEVSAGHAMADLLSVYWTVDGQPVLEASGTYSYGAAGLRSGSAPLRPRRYFRSPAAHNGLALAGHDPLGEPQGRFRGPDNGTRVVTRAQALPGGLAWVEGRLAAQGPLEGYRRGMLQVFGHYSLVYDRLPPLAEDAAAAFHWQFAPEAEVSLGEGRQVSARFGDFAVRFAASAGLGPLECVKGRSDPPAGWVSRGYGQLAAAPQVICPLQAGARDLAFAFALTGENAAPLEVEVVAAAGDGLLIEVCRGGHRGIACFGSVAASRETLSFDLDFAGEALWLDFEDGVCREVRALGVMKLRSAELGFDVAAEAARLPRGWQAERGSFAGAGLCLRWRRPSDG